MMCVLWFQEYSAEHETKAMSSLFQLVCQLYQVMFVTLTVKARRGESEACSADLIRMWG